MYAALARPAGIVGAIVVESAAQFIDDNLWYLEVSRDNPIMVGVSGNIDPGSNEFTKYLNHFHRDPLFRAIRSSRFYTSDASGKIALNPAQVANLKLLAQADLALIDALAGAAKAEVACSRPVAEGLDWLAKDRYIGVSGAHISPDL